MIDRAALVDRALRESESLDEAQAKVEAMLRLAGVGTEREVLQEPSATPPQHAATPATQKPPPRAKRTKADSRIQWHRRPDLCERATTLLDTILDLGEVARLMNCSRNALCGAIAKGHLKPKEFRVNPLDQARGFKSAITLGKKLRDWNEAQRVIDIIDNPHQGQVNGASTEQ